MAIQLCRYCWAPSSSLLADLTVVDWFLRLRSCATSSSLIGVTVFTTTNISSSSLMGDVIPMLVISFPCRLHMLSSMDNFDYDKMTSYILRGLPAQTQVSYLQFGLVLDTCNMNSWS
uniref:Uncharacterized protein n=1 Tax=Oryza sativa subsp. japonica TaxID=39947 RepID=Q10IY0_ORYSJ|nr:hypothetical protein LOC_Os03g32664 [Oryza sativa Japonica Group]